MKKLLSLILAMVMCLSLVSAVFGAEMNFTDVKTSDWFYDEIKSAVEIGLINGKTETCYAPNDNLTYAEAIKLAACMSQVYLHGYVSLSSGTPWYQPYADYCTMNNIITKKYDYNAKATRAGYIEIFAKALPDSAFNDINNIPDGSILDVKDNAPYAIYVYKMYRAGIVTGVDALHNCKPEDNIKRSEVAAIICRMMDEEKRVEFDMPGASGEEEPEIAEPGKDNQKVENWDEPVNIEPENPEFTNKVPTQEITQDITVVPTVPGVEIEKPVINADLTIHKQPEGMEAESYGVKAELEVQVFGGKAPYTYEWYYKERRDSVTIKDGDYVKDATTEAIVLSVEEENTLLGANIYCKITDSLGDSVTTEAVKVYGPFSMPVENYSIVSANKEYTLVGRVADGILRKEEKVSVIRNGKVIAIGVAKDLQMFYKSVDKTVKGDNVGIIFDKQDGVAPGAGDTVVKYQAMHEIDTSDIVN